MKRKDILKTGLAGILGISLFMGGASYAYLQSSSKSVVNNFQAYIVNVALNETTGSNYDIIPGTVASKDPKVTVAAGLPVYVFVEVTDTTNGYVQYQIAAGWTQLENYDNVYYTVSDGTVERTYNVLKDNQVSYPDQTNESMAAGVNSQAGLNLTFQAHAIQKDPFNSALEAYDAIKSVGVATEPEKDTDELNRTVYHLSTPEHILWLSDFVNNGGTTQQHDDSKKIVFQLEQSIDMKHTVIKPIGFNKNADFWGIFDGQGYTLSNVAVEVADSDDHAVGLFGWMRGTVKDLNIETISVTGGKYTGSIAGHAVETNTAISNVHVSNATIRNVRAVPGRTSGLVGIIGNRMENCSVTNANIYVDAASANRAYELYMVQEGAPVHNNTAVNVNIHLV